MVLPSIFIIRAEVENHSQASLLRRRYWHSGQVRLRWIVYACSWSVPNSAAECVDVDLRGVVGVENDAAALLEVVALDACPMNASVGRAVGGSVKAGDIERIGMVGIDGHVVDVLHLREDIFPRAAAVVRGKDAAIPVGAIALLSPCRQVETMRIAWVNLQGGGAGDAWRNIHTLPVFRL